MWPHESDYSAYAEPAVPVELIKYTCGTESFDEFLRSGFEVASMLDLALRKFTGRTFKDFATVLDFGCGCGRLIRFVEPGNALFGCDVNRQALEFCKEHFPRAAFYQNDLMPPLIYRDGLFNLVYSFSVFSHLRRDVEEAWLKELVRVGAPGCIYLLTVHGDWVIDKTLGADAELARRQGFFYKEVHQRHHTENDFPDYYEASYHTAEFIHANWTSHFDILGVVKGDRPERYLPDEERAGVAQSPPPLRPMGQDLVVAIKRCGIG